MSQNTAPLSPKPAPGPAGGPSRDPGWHSGGTLFAGVLMLVGGILGVLIGITGIAKDDVYARIGTYVYEFNLTTWGWIHLVIGVIVAITGWGVLKGHEWARAVGIAVAALYMIEYFMFLPYEPVWSVIAIAVAVFVMWALATGGGSPETA
ncbi:DUF7144 family membrane protein [Streptomyces sp. 142MFCol3.1]|uniref:DUF7144 family membrane protein n=1 Tax=Streptomyces sp. 142MFCol3.1 TaxID=1172179 RepID=UPI00041ED572|nr:hypothetical protein [Streptomyces sp. 142MFCol3.1]